MVYIKRTAEKVIEKIVSTFKIALVTGPRQVGKSTLLKELYGAEYEYVTFDDINELHLATSDPKLFFINHPGKLIIDEVQLCPEIFSELKRIVDSTDEVGQFILTGSQTFALMQNVSESLAGRVGIMELKPLSTQEIIGHSQTNAFVPSTTLIHDSHSELNYSQLWEIIHRGSLPELYRRPEMDWEMYYSSYLTTFIQRDVRQLTAIQDLNLFN